MRPEVVVESAHLHQDWQAPHWTRVAVATADPRLRAFALRCLEPNGSLDTTCLRTLARAARERGLELTAPIVEDIDRLLPPAESPRLARRLLARQAATPKAWRLGPHRGPRAA